MGMLEHLPVHIWYRRDLLGINSIVPRDSSGLAAQLPNLIQQSPDDGGGFPRPVRAANFPDTCPLTAQKHNP